MLKDEVYKLAENLRIEYANRDKNTAMTDMDFFKYTYDSILELVQPLIKEKK